MGAFVLNHVVIFRAFTLVFLIVGIGGLNPSSAQISLKDLNLDNDLDVWFQEISGETPPPYLQGMEYSINGQSKDQHQFYKSLSWADGGLTFSNRELHHVKLLYNAYEDQLIALNIGMKASGVPAILLNQYLVGAFTIHHTKFVHLQNRPLPPSGKGFYELYYEGKNFNVFVKHSKLKDTSVSGVVYKEKKEVYMLLDGAYVLLVNKRSLYRLFPEQKDQLKRFARNNGVRFSKQRQEGLSELLKFCDERLEEQ